jgi:hypothetical protein
MDWMSLAGLIDRLLQRWDCGKDLASNPKTGARATALSWIQGALPEQCRPQLLSQQQ